MDKKNVKMLVEYGFSPAEEVALFNLQLAAPLLSPIWEGDEWAEEQLTRLVGRANALLLTGVL